MKKDFIHSSKRGTLFYLVAPLFGCLATSLPAQTCEVFRDDFNGNTKFTGTPYPYGDYVCGYPNYANFGNTGSEEYMLLGCGDEAELRVKMGLPYGEYTITFKYRTEADASSNASACDWTHFDEMYKAGCSLPMRLVVIDDSMVFKKTGAQTNYEQTATINYTGAIDNLYLSFATYGYPAPYQTFYDYISVATSKPLKPDFALPFECVALGDSAPFINTTEGSGKTWLWDFGDGSISDQRNPVHAYSSVGQYTVRLRVTDVCNKTDSVSKTIEVKDVAAKADFSYTTNGTTVSFTLHSDKALDWAWDFGDGETGTEKNPVHTYPDENIYQACLKVKGECNIDSLCKIVYMGILGVGDNPSDELNLRLYPQPASSSMSLDIPETAGNKEKAEFSIVNVMGTKVFPESAYTSGVYVINTESLPQGTYLLVLNMNGDTIMKRFTVVKN